MSFIPFNKPFLTGEELHYVEQSLLSGHLSGNGPFSKKCSSLLNKYFQSKDVLLTHSCTGALEMMALIIGIMPGDEVIMPSYTFVSSANAFVNYGAVPVFVDVEEKSFNVSIDKIKSAITRQTKAILAVNYAGGSCELDVLRKLCDDHQIYLLEDAAQSLGAKYKNQSLGTFGDLSAFSFHETKNIQCGEGGALVVNNKDFVEMAHIVWEKGTNRRKFFQGKINKYQWVGKGSSFLMSDLSASFLYSQLKNIHLITQQRLLAWNSYHSFFSKIAKKNNFKVLSFLDHVQHNGHIFALIFSDQMIRSNYIEHMQSNKINCVFHYSSLHSSDAGKLYGRSDSFLSNTEKASNCLVRLPMWNGVDTKKVIAASTQFFDL